MYTIRLVDVEPVRQTSLFSFMDGYNGTGTLMLFKLDAILAIAPMSLVTIIEHVGDITANSAVVGRFKKDLVSIGLTCDGIATSFAGL